jgi:hypothetical protein
MINGKYDRSYRSLELWAAALAALRHPSTFSEDDLEAALTLALRYIHEGVRPDAQCHAMYVIGRCLMLLRDQYPDWREWVGHAAVLASDGALVSGDITCQERTESLFVDYVNLLAPG